MGQGVGGGAIAAGMMLGAGAHFAMLAASSLQVLHCCQQGGGHGAGSSTHSMQHTFGAAHPLVLKPLT
jgi:hypothetical protein